VLQFAPLRFRRASFERPRGAWPGFRYRPSRIREGGQRRAHRFMNRICRIRRGRPRWAYPVLRSNERLLRFSAKELRLDVSDQGINGEVNELTTVYC
jgi:hypothetical protein